MINSDDFDDLPLPGEPRHAELSARVRLAYRIYELEVEVNNGGIHQFFGNSSGAHTPSTVEAALQTIGATHSSEVLRAATSNAYPSGFPKDPSLHEDERRNDDETLDRLSVLDDQFYRYENNLTGLVNAYLNGKP